MNPNFLRNYLLVFLLIISVNLKAQRFDSTLKKLDAEYRQEKLYLHFDRSFYNPGETIWFKAYLFAGNFPSLISKTLYTELVDAKGKILQRITAPVVMSSAAGSLVIPQDVGGNLIVRAYTKWMLNFDSSFLYTKAISILPFQKSAGKLSSSATKINNVAPATSSISLQFFPEGGDLVQGIESRVAFKATDHNGMPLNISGEILDSKGKRITPFVSLHDGMGIFNFAPAIAEQYKAVWYERAQKHEMPLPSAKQNGIVLEVNNLTTQIEFKINHTINAPYPFVYIVAQMNQQLVYRAKANIGKTTTVSGTIPVENLPSGIIQITVFTPDEKPVAERIVFANSTDYSFMTDLNSPVKDIGKRKKNVIQIDVPDTVSCNLSVAITDADINPVQTDDNIYSHILLTSDIKGYVYNPAYYFSSDADSVANHLDLVMMTNGWRRFKWEDALAAHFPKLNYLPENYLSIEGQVQGLSKTQLSGKAINTIIELKNKNKQFLTLPVQPTGKFLISGLIFYDTAKMYYQFNNDKDKTLTSRASFDIKSNLLKDPLNIVPDNTLFAAISQPDTQVTIKSKEVYREEINQLSNEKIKTLKTVVITAKKKTQKEILDEEYTSGFFSGGDSRIILPEDDPAFLSSPNLLSYLQSRIAGLQISVNGIDASVTWRGSPTAIFVNEIQQQDVSQIMTLPMSDIALVKIFSPPFFGASGAGAGGAIAVYLKKGASANDRVKGLDYTMISGYTPAKEFYSPDYSKPDVSDAPDYRPTLY
ncbi:MAG: hypothetical protein M3004_09150, partial [Bacteroidota bacterium]|nr:hypothetical protein [Bacteroidota bacterium]